MNLLPWLLPLSLVATAPSGRPATASLSRVTTTAATQAPADDASATWRETRLTLSGATLVYTERGRGETVLFVHGALEDQRAWLEVAEPLAAKFHVVRYTRRGYEPGSSQPAGTWIAQTKDLITLLQAVDGAGVHLVGDGDGAVIALLAARERPHLVRSLTLVEPGMDGLIVDAKVRKALAREQSMAVAGVRAAVMDQDPAAAVRLATNWISGDEACHDRLPESVRAMFAEHVARESFTEYGAMPGCEDLWRVRAPALIVADAAPDPEAVEYGTASATVSRLVTSADALAHCIKSSRRVSMTTPGPMPQHLQPVALARLIREFAEENARTRMASE
jgi:pimeloyl-ACP methyl ester carboxylesterase